MNFTSLEKEKGQESKPTSPSIAALPALLPLPALPSTGRKLSHVRHFTT